jgi:hypothetical protein
MSRWFRFYGEALNDHKVQSLSPDLYKTWVNLLCAASLNEGVLPTAERLSFELRVSAHEMQSRLDELILLGLLDIRSDKRLEPHNWEKRQWKSDDSAERVRKHRHGKRHGNDDVTVTVTPPESYSESDTESIGLPSSQAAARKGEDQKGLNKFFEMKDDRKKEQLHRRAEGLGLDVAELLDACHVHKAKNKPAYFTTLAVQRLSAKLPGIDEKVIRAALWDKSDHAYTAVMQALLVAA